ncbi:hypothetical protein B0H13DRAFT_1919693 [Mycena leptocephala]|nr:hypothetical protein B0H13DRAFT_1923128 [Mycena leptocephala]KAJ7823288.1 hypothetical protein B0H13DRAFT_1919693 [Mycena leptocephala]
MFPLLEGARLLSLNHYHQSRDASEEEVAHAIKHKGRDQDQECDDLKHKGRDQDQERDDLKSQEGRLISSTRSNNGRSASKRKAQDDDQDEDEHPPPSKKAKKILKDTSNVADRPVSQDGRQKRTQKSTMSRLMREGDAIYENPPKPTAKPTIPTDVPDNDQAPPLRGNQRFRTHEDHWMPRHPSSRTRPVQCGRELIAQRLTARFSGHIRPQAAPTRDRTRDRRLITTDGPHSPVAEIVWPLTGRRPPTAPTRDRRLITTDGPYSPAAELVWPLTGRRPQTAPGPTVDDDQRPTILLRRVDFENMDNGAAGRTYQRPPVDRDRQPGFSLGLFGGANDQRQNQQNPPRRDGSQFDHVTNRGSPTQDHDEEPDQWQNNNDNRDGHPEDDDQDYQYSNNGAQDEDEDANSINSENLDDEEPGGQRADDDDEDDGGSCLTMHTASDTNTLGPGNESFGNADDGAADYERRGRKERRGGDDRRAEVPGSDRIVEAQDVVAKHRKKNKATRPPNPAQLEFYRRLQQDGRDDEEVGGEGDDDDNDNRDDDDRDSDDRDNESQDEASGGGRKQRTRRLDSPPPTQMGFFEPVWRQVLEKGKGKGNHYLVLRNLFPDKETFLDLARREFLTEAIAEVEDEHGIDLDRAFYLKHQSDMVRILWDEVSHYRGESKTSTRPAFHLYNTKPDYARFEGRGFNQEEWVQATAQKIADLIRSSEFLHNGRDADGHKNNFMSTGLEFSVEILLFGRAGSRGDAIATQYPQDFEKYSDHVMAAGATVLKSVMDEWATGRWANVAFKASEYSRYYKLCLALIDKLKKNPREWGKTSEEWSRWRQRAFASRGLIDEDAIMEDTNLIDIDLS